ncbi:hypothetical protein BH11MYX3_BH11MYX3_02810 [soil metagenome]
MTTYEKIAISLPTRAAEHARRAVRQGRAPSVSAYVVAAIEAKEATQSLEALFDELLAESGGPLTASEIKAAERELGIVPKRSRPRRAR